jgi:hypothetical protein
VAGEGWDKNKNKKSSFPRPNVDARSWTSWFMYMCIFPDTTGDLISFHQSTERVPQVSLQIFQCKLFKPPRFLAAVDKVCLYSLIPVPHFRYCSFSCTFISLCEICQSRIWVQFILVYCLPSLSLSLWLLRSCSGLSFSCAQLVSLKQSLRSVVWTAYGSALLLMYELYFLFAFEYMGLFAGVFFTNCWKKRGDFCVSFSC